MRGNAHVPAPRTGADRKMDALNFIMRARPAMIDHETADTLAKRYGVPVAWVGELLDARRQQGMDL
ncbi:MAG: hypothetical protein ACRYGI_11490 [Janthinobacterium lividum]